MKRLFHILVFVGALLSIMYICASCDHIPTKPSVEYNSELSIIQIVQTDTAAHDSAYISIDDIYNEIILIKDTVRFSIPKAIKKVDQVNAAYELVKNNNVLNVSVRTTRTNDTIFQYHYNNIEFKQIDVADVVYGQCVGLYDANYNRNYHEIIREWIFKNNLIPDSSNIDNMNKILRQFNYNGRNEYKAISGNVPIVISLSGLKYKFKTHLNGDFFYLFAYSCTSGMSIRSFVESKVKKDFVDAHNSNDDEFECSNKGSSGPNVLFLIGIDKQWKYEVLPVGIVVIDDVAPSIYTKGFVYNDFRRRYSYDNYDNFSSISWPKYVTLPSQNMQINIPKLSSSISSSVSVSYGSFEGNDYFGYNIPFYVEVDGDVRLLTIGKYKFDVNKINKGSIRLNFKNLHIGDNNVPLTATDSRGNKSTRNLSIPIAPIRRNVSNYDDYDDLENRVNELEDRLNDLE